MKGMECLTWVRVMLLERLLLFLIMEGAMNEWMGFVW